VSTASDAGVARRRPGPGRGPVIACFAALSFACACAAAAPPADDPVARRVLEAEDAYVVAEVNRDEAALRRLVDEHFVFNRADGRTTGKEALVTGVMGMSMVGQDLRERTVRVEGPVALVFGTADLRFEAPDGGETVSSLRYTSTWVERGGEWRLLALQMQGRAAD